MTAATNLDGVTDAVIGAVRDTLDMVARHAPVVLACSGGPDSVGLLHLVAAVRPDLAVTVTHVDHGFIDQQHARGLVAMHAARHNMACVSVTVTVTPGSHGVEAAARDVRYDALEQVAERVGAAHILTGHTADDLAETVWMRIIRGTGPDGLSAMMRASGRVLRPLLTVRRPDVHAFVAANGWAVVDDPMNHDRTFLRVRIRDELVPVLQSLGDDAVGAAVRLAELAEADRRFFAAHVADTVPLTRLGDAAVAVRRGQLAALDVALASRVLRQMLSSVTTGRGRTPAQPSLADVFRVLRASGPTRFTLAGAIDVTVDTGWVTAVNTAAAVFEPVAVRSDVPVHVGLFGVWLACGHAVVSGWDGPDGMGDPARFRVRLKSRGGLTLRAALPGDTVWNAGRDVPVKTVLANAGIPVVLRRRWPVVTDGQQVLWVPGCAVNEDAQTSDTDPTGVDLVFVESVRDDG